MEITLQLKGPLKKYADGAELIKFELDINDQTVSKLLQKFKIPTSSVSFIQINGVKKDHNHPIKGGDTVTINPRVAGG